MLYVNGEKTEIKRTKSFPCAVWVWSRFSAKLQLSEFNLNEIKCDIFAEQVSKLVKLIVLPEKEVKNEGE